MIRKIDGNVENKDNINFCQENLERSNHNYSINNNLWNKQKK